MVYLIFQTTLLSFIITFKCTDASPVTAEASIPGESQELSENITSNFPQTPPCCKEYNPPPPYRLVPRPNRFREGVCKEGNATYQAGDQWNYDPECVEHECKEDGTVVIHKCPPEPASVSEGWEFISESGQSGGFANFYPFCCKRAVPPSNPKEPGCYVGNRTVEVGVQVDVPGRCYHHVCTGNNQWSTSDCGILGSWRAWEVLPADTSKPYPDCCGKAVPILDIVPDVLEDLPSFSSLGVVYGNTSVDYGNELTPTHVGDPPGLVNPLPSSDPSGNKWNLLLMTDPDSSYSGIRESREFLHWMVGNFQGNNVSSGDILAEYVGSAPAKGSGMHRYIFFLYEQPERLDFEEVRLNNTTLGWRGNFSSRKFAEKYHLGNPLGFNVFRAQWDESVPEILKQFGIEAK